MCQLDEIGTVVEGTFGCIVSGGVKLYSWCEVVWECVNYILSSSGTVVNEVSLEDIGRVEQEYLEVNRWNHWRYLCTAW